MFKKKVLIAAMLAGLCAAEGVYACTIFAIGKDATVDGSTMTTHTCDSTSDDLRLWVIPSMPAGTERDIVLNGRAGADYSHFPEIKDYGPSGMVMDTYIQPHDTNQYLHGMYSFCNDKGLAMGESTMSYDRNSDQGKKVKEAFKNEEGIYDCYMLQDLALENCSTAREAVEFMGNLVTEKGWYGSGECIDICDGNEAWVLEVYGGHMWVAVRVPDDSIYVAANRGRVNYFIENDPDNYLYAPNIKEFAKEKGLWDGTSDFIPCYTFAPYPYRPYSTHREWIALTTLDPSLKLDPEEKETDTKWPLFVKPQKKVSVQDIYELCGNYYQGTDLDITKSIWAGQFGDPLNPAQNSTQRSINSFRCTYVQIANIKSWLPPEARCLVWYGYCAPAITYLTPIFASQSELAPHFGIGMRDEYDPASGWWTNELVQMLARVNYTAAIEDIKAVRDPKMAAQYDLTFAVQNQAAKMLKDGKHDEAINLLTTYANQQAVGWKATYDTLAKHLITRFALGADNMKTRLPYTDYWNKLAESDWQQYI